MAARCIAALAKLGHWPAQAEELHDRSVLPDDAYEILRAICRAKAGDPALAWPGCASCSPLRAGRGRAHGAYRAA